MLRVIAILLCFTLLACGPIRRPVPVGEVPAAPPVSTEDEQYGQAVFGEFMKQYKLDTDDRRILRVRDIVDRLASAAQAGQQPWHVHLFADDTFKNAAATRGNFIFVWSGILQSVQSDDELATVLAHEMGHVLAGHTQQSPQEEAARVLSGVAGAITSGVLAGRGIGPQAGDVAGSLVRILVDAVAINPEQQRQEHEADQIGIFLMADAGYDPEGAVAFWRRALNDPTFSGFKLGFLSTHPSTDERLTRLEAVLPSAMDRFRGFRPAPPPSARDRRDNFLAPPAPRGSADWTVDDLTASVYQEANRTAPIVAELPYGTAVVGRSVDQRWLEIFEPYQGFMLLRDLRFGGSP